MIKNDVSYVFFSKKGLLAHTFCYNTKTKKGTHKDLPINNIIAALRQKCEIKKGTTLRDFCNCVVNNKQLRDFISPYSWCKHIDEWHAQLNEKSKKCSDIKKLEISWRSDLFRKELGIYTNFYGLGKNETYSISGSNLSAYADIPIVLNENLTIYEDYNKSILECKKSFTLLDVLDAFYWDISFHGGPKESEKFFEDLHERVKNLDKEKCIPWEDVKKKLEKSK